MVLAKDVSMLEADQDRRWEERVTEERVREAVDARRFHLHYQPIVSVTGGDVVGVEALLRLSSDVGRVRSENFLPIIDSERLWGEVGRWVLERACREALPWAAEEIWLTVNVSTQQLEPGYAEGVLQTLATTGLPPELLCLELTATTGLRDPATAWTELRVLKSHGVGLMIDDFGTAGSSIEDLARFRLDAVKIDPAFVAGLGAEPEAEAIVAALVGLAHALDMQAVAEGVETPGQLHRLQALGCDLAQGFHVQRPGDAGTIARFIAASAGHRPAALATGDSRVDISRG